MGWFDELSKDLTEDQKKIAKISIPFFVAVLSGAITVLSFTNQYIFPRSEANNLIKQIEVDKSSIDKNQEQILKRLDKLEEKIMSGSDGNNKELLSRIQTIDNNINRRIDLLYEKLLERKR